MKRGYASIRSGQVHYYEAGQGAPLLLLHSAPRSARAYRVLLPLLAQHFRCIAADLPGFGNSDPLPGKVTMDALGAAMADFLDAKGIPKAHVFGYHTGNKVAAAMGATQPHSVDRVVLSGQIHSIIPDKKERDDAIRHIVEKYFTTYPDPLRKWRAQWEDQETFAFPKGVYARADVTQAEIDEYRLRVVDHLQGLPAVQATYAANFDFDFGAALARIAAKTLVLEFVMPDEEHMGRQLDAVCALLRNGRGETIMNAGRVAIESHAAEIARSVTTFLKEAA